MLVLDFVPAANFGAGLDDPENDCCGQYERSREINPSDPVPDHVEPVYGHDDTDGPEEEVR